MSNMSTGLPFHTSPSPGRRTLGGSESTHETDTAFLQHTDTHVMATCTTEARGAEHTATHRLVMIYAVGWDP